MFRTRKTLFVEDLINREYMRSTGYNADENDVYVKGNSLSVVNINITPLTTDHLYKIYCTVVLLSFDLTIKFRVYDNNSAPVYKVLDDLEDKIKAYEAIVKFVES